MKGGHSDEGGNKRINVVDNQTGGNYMAEVVEYIYYLLCPCRDVQRRFRELRHEGN